MRQETVEAEKAKRIAALTETFKKWGWDSRVPRAISRWGEFGCGDSSFTLKIKPADKAGWETEVNLLLSEPSHHGDPIRHLSLRYGWGGRNLEIHAFPISRMYLFDVGDGIGVGNVSKQRLLIEAPWQKMQIAIDSDGELCNMGQGFAELYFEMSR